MTAPAPVGSGQWQAQRRLLPLPPGVVLKSLHFHGPDVLIDWVGGGTRYHRDGRVVPGTVDLGHDFDTATVSDDGSHVILSQRRGLAAAVVRCADGVRVRTLNRDVYHAADYDHPAGFVRLADGRLAVVNCPESWEALELSDLTTGAVLSRRDPAGAGVFHSHLHSSPDGRWLFSVGWLWHPVQIATLVDVTAALDRPALWDDGLTNWIGDSIEVDAAAWAGPDALRVMLSTYGGGDDPPYGSDDFSLPGPIALADIDPVGLRVRRLVPLSYFAGQPYPLTPRYCLACNRWPTLIDGDTGATVADWSDLDTGAASGFVGVTPPPVRPAFAVHAASRRFAVAGADGITVVDVALPADA